MKKLFLHNRKKLNNEGVTLVEMLVAIIILSIVVGGFYSCFVLAAKTNAKAKLNHKATTLAQNVLESIKAEDMDTLMQQVVWPTYSVAQEDGSIRTVQNFRLVSQSGYDTNNVVVLSTDPLATSNDGGITGTYNPGLSAYSFCLRNVKMENTGFDVLVTVKKSAAVDIGDNSIASRDMVYIPSMDSNYDGVVSNAAVYDREALSYFESKGVYDALSPGSGDITRTITVDVDETEMLSGSVEYQVDATYRYDCQSEVYEVSDMIFSNEEDTTRGLRNIFLFFNPHFQWLDAGWTEKIVVNNPDDYEMDLYLIKQQPTENEADLASEATNPYRVDVYVNEGNTDGEDRSSIEIKTNLGYKFSSPTEPISMNRQAQYYFNGVAKDVDFFNLTALTNKGESELLFDVNIKIYEGDEARVVDDLTDYDGVALLTELNGTLRN